MATYIINDETSLDELFPDDKARGLDMSARPRGYAYGGVAEPFPAELLIPRSEWEPRIKERTERKARLCDIAEAEEVKVKDQARTNYCWGNSPVWLLELVRAIQGLPRVSLSPASICGPLTGFQNVGGWGKTALEYLIKNGAVPSSKWADNAIDSRLNTPENRKLALAYRNDEWNELQPRNLDQLVSCLLRNRPVSGGFNWWSHQVSLIDPVWLDGEVAILFANSWGEQYGTKGYGVLQGQRMLPDDAVAPRTALAA